MNGVYGFAPGDLGWWTPGDGEFGVVDTWGWGGGGGGRDKWVLGLFQGFLLILKYTFIIIQSRIKIIHCVVLSTFCFD